MRRKDDERCIAQNVVKGDDAEDGGVEKALPGVARDPEVLLGNVESAERPFQGSHALDEQVFRPPRSSKANDRADAAKFRDFSNRIRKSPD